MVTRRSRAPDGVPAREAPGVTVVDKSTHLARTLPREAGPPRTQSACGGCVWRAPSGEVGGVVLDHGPRRVTRSHTGASGSTEWVDSGLPTGVGEEDEVGHVEGGAVAAEGRAPVGLADDGEPAAFHGSVECFGDDAGTDPS